DGEPPPEWGSSLRRLHRQQVESERSADHLVFKDYFPAEKRRLPELPPEVTSALAQMRSWVAKQTAIAAFETVKAALAKQPLDDEGWNNWAGSQSAGVREELDELADECGSMLGKLERRVNKQSNDLAARIDELENRIDELENRITELEGPSDGT